MEIFRLALQLLVVPKLIQLPITMLHFVTCLHYENFVLAIYRDFFQLKKLNIFLEKNSYFCSKHRLWVHVAEAVLTSTHNLCFGAKIRKIGIPPTNPSFTI